MDKLQFVYTSDVKPVVHGRWMEKRWTTDYDWGLINHRVLVCTACSVEIADGEETPYCPYCGAKMYGEEKHMAWELERPEPEYPTWAKWLEEMGLIQIQWNGPVLASMRIGVDDTEYIPVKMKMLEHIPADIAQKLGLQQK